MHVENAIRSQVEKATGKISASAPIRQLKGDASNRSYYRVGTAPSHVVMVMPKDALKKSEEATQGEPPKELPFVNVHRYLTMLGVRVPKILRYDEDEAMMVLEDLGDVTFEASLTPQNREEMYTRAVKLLAKMRAEAEQKPDASCLAFTRAFDEQLYDWELHHFREYGMEIWSGKKPTSAERQKLDEIFRGVAKQLAAAPRGFTHRDYQSRNLMIVGDELVVIDFQDALQGPRQYDLVALLRDSYVELEPEFVRKMLDRYRETFESLTGEKIAAEPFNDFFDLLTVQRKLKDAGRFEYIHRVKGNPGFLVSIPASLRYVKNALDRRKDLAPLREIVAKYVPELG
jgi:N-acetylmuramate 1-kinase